MARVDQVNSQFYRLHFTEDAVAQKRRLDKALLSGSGKVLLIGPWLQFPEQLQQTRTICIQNHRQICLQLSHKDLQLLQSDIVESLPAQFSELIITIDPSERTYSGHLEFLYAFKEQLFFLLEFRESFDVTGLFSAMPIWIREKISFHPCGLRLKAKQIHSLGQNIQKLFPEVQFRTLPGLDHFDLRISDEVQLMPHGKIELEFKTKDLSARPEISVIIPTYDNQEYLLNCLRHLLAQNIPRKSFEIIVVDDGTPQLNMENIKSFLLPEAGDLNFSYFYLPKTLIPNSSFGNFRAGLCRNFGFTHSVGQYITFLDSDMITPPDFLSNVIKQLQTTDLLQSVRHHIHPSKSDRFATYGAISEKNLFIEEKAYWGPFFAADNWMSISDFWKFTCTYSLSMKRSFFESMGRFRKSYVCYGFEDTDFGYQAFRSGARFTLDKTRLYHLTPYSDKSRYKHSLFYKHQLLRLTAKTFYLNTLSSDIFSKLKTFMD